MSIENDLYGKIRRCQAEGLSKRKTAARLGISRNTVKKYWLGEVLPDERAPRQQAPSPDKEAVMQELREYFEKYKDEPRKQAVNAKTAWESLSCKLRISQATVRRYVREIKGEKQAECFVPLAFDPGEVIQFDWCDIHVYIKGINYKFALFCAVLPYSFAIFAALMPDMTQPSLLFGHIMAFEFFGGTPRRAIYDNMKTAVLSGGGKSAVANKNLERFLAHYGLNPEFCAPRRGNEKGSLLFMFTGQ